MKDLFKKGLYFAAAAICSFAVATTNVYASDNGNVINEDSSGNFFGAGQLVNVASQIGTTVGNEAFLAGMDVRADGVDIDGNAFVAGQSVSISDSTVGSSIFAAGSNVTINASASNNIFVAGASVIVGEDTSVKGLHIASGTAVVSGNYDAVNISAGTVTFNGKCTGDVKIEAEEIIFGDDALIEGNLTVVSAIEPDVDGIVEGEYAFEEVKSVDDSVAVTDSGEMVVKAAKATAGAVILGAVKSTIFRIFRYVVLAIVLLFVFKRNLEMSYESAIKRPGAHWGFGALFTICFPIMALITAITVIGAPVAGLATAFYVLALCVARVFTFASLGRELLFDKIAKKRLNPYGEVAIMGVIAAVIKAIPVVGSLVGLACAFYMIGYVCLSLVTTIKENNKKQPVIEAEAETEA